MCNTIVFQYLYLRNTSDDGVYRKAKNTWIYGQIQFSDWKSGQYVTTNVTIKIHSYY